MGIWLVCIFYGGREIPWRLTDRSSWADESIDERGDTGNDRTDHYHFIIQCMDSIARLYVDRSCCFCGFPHSPCRSCKGPSSTTWRRIGYDDYVWHGCISDWSGADRIYWKSFGPPV